MQLKVFIICTLYSSTSFSIESFDKTCATGEACVLQDDCPSFLKEKSELTGYSKESKDYKRLLERIRRKVCNRQKKAVCCEQNSNVEFDDYSPAWLPEKDECGVNPEGALGRVIGGENTQPGQFPFTALLGYTVKRRISGRDVEETRYKCGGTLINHWFVVTAAHCQGRSKSSQISSVRLGEYLVGTNPDCITGSSVCLPSVQDFSIKKDQVTVHEGYERTPKNIVNDIALVKLDRPATFNVGVAVACLPIDEQSAARQLNLPNLKDGLTGISPIVVGWGYTEYDPFKSGDQGDFASTGVASSVQQMLEVPILRKEECKAKWDNKYEPAESQICAGGEIGKDSCKGDSGGPLYLSRVGGTGIPILDGTNPLYLIGLVSFGSKQCAAGRPGVYTKIDSFIPWIKKIIGNTN